MSDVSAALLPPGASRVLESRSPAMRSALERAMCFAEVKRPLLLVGPVGSGKTTLARLVHRLSGRSGELVTLSAGELKDTLLHDALFGHVSGAYTGATERRRGALEQAARGTLLFDDVAHVQKSAQLALLRALEDRTFRPLGASRDLPVTFRDIYATTVDPADLVGRGAWTEDFASRVRGFEIDVPGLDRRPEDIPDLARYFAESFLTDHQQDGRVHFADDVLDAFVRYPWTGHLRQLRRVVEFGIAMAGYTRSEITVELQHIIGSMAEHNGSGSATGRVSVAEIIAAVERSDGNHSEAARRLGVHRNTVRRKLKEAGM